MKKKVYGVYTHARPNGAVFYVGKGTKERAYKKDRDNRGHKRIVNKHGWKNIIIRFYKCLSEEHAFIKEKQTIKNYRRKGVRLVNRNDGGEGVSGYRASRKQRLARKQQMQNPKIRKHLSRKMKEYYKNNPVAKKKLIKRLSKLVKSKKIREKLRKRLKRQLRSKEFKRKLIAGLRKKNNREKQSLAKKKLWENPKWRNKIIEKITKGQNKSDTRKKRIRETKKLWKDAEYRKKQLIARSKSKRR